MCKNNHQTFTSKTDNSAIIGQIVSENESQNKMGPVWPSSEHPGRRFDALLSCARVLSTCFSFFFFLSLSLLFSSSPFLIVKAIKVVTLNCFQCSVGIYLGKHLMLLYIVLQGRKANTLQSGDTFCIHIDVPCKVWCNLITGRSFNFISPPNWILSRTEYLKALSRRMSSHSRNIHWNTWYSILEITAFVWASFLFGKYWFAHEETQVCMSYVSGRKAAPIQASDNSQRSPCAFLCLLLGRPQHANKLEFTLIRLNTCFVWEQ